MNYAEWANWYDLFYSTESSDEVDFYLHEALNADGPVLEIGVGTGRIAIPAAAQGVEVVGVDASAEMLAVAEEKARAASPMPGSLTLTQADMRSLDLGRKDFALVTIPARTLLLATTYDDQLKTLCSVARHVWPGGRLVFNVFNPTPDLIFDESDERVEIGEVVEPGSGMRYRLTAINRFDAESQINDAVQVVEEIGNDGSSTERARLSVRLRYLLPHEVFSMLDETSLVVESVFGWFDRTPFDEGSDELIFVAKSAELGGD